MMGSSSALERWVERLIAFARRRPGAVIAAAGAAALASLLLLPRLALENNLLRLLPREGRAVQALDAFLEHFGTLDHLYVLFETSEEGLISDHQEFVDAYLEALRRAPEVSRVDTALFDRDKDWSYLLDRQLLLVDSEQWTRTERLFEPSGMEQALVRSREALSLPSSALKAAIQQDPLGLFSIWRERAARGSLPLELNPMEEGYVSRDGRSRLVIVKPIEPPFDAEFCRKLARRLEGIEAEARESHGAPSVRVELAGGYRVALEAERLIRSELLWNSIGSLACILLLVVGVLRNPWMLAYAALPLSLAVVMALAVLAAGGHRLLAAATGGAAMLFGLGVDGVLLLYLRHLEPCGSEEELPNLAAAGASLTLGNVTTAATFVVLLTIDFPSLQELGRLVGMGILLCCFWTLTLVPAFAVLVPVSRRRQPLSTRALGRFVEGHWRSILLVAALLTLVLGATATRLRVDTRLERLQPMTEGTEVERRIAERFAIPQDVLLAVAGGPGLEELLVLHQRLRRALIPLGEAVVVGSPVDLLPPRLLQDQAAERLASLSAARIAANLEATAERAGFRSGAFAPFIERLPRLLDAGQRLSFQGFLDHGLSDIISRFVVRTEDGYLTVAYIYPRPSFDRPAVEAAVAGLGPGLSLTGIPLVNRELSQAFLPELLQGLLLGAALVTVIILFGLRSLKLTALSLLPTALGVLWSAGVLAVLDYPMDMFSAFGLVLVIGVAVDYGIHVVHRRAAEGRKSSVAEVVGTTGAAVLLAGLTTLIGFGTLVNSSYAPLRSLGLVSAVAIVASLAASLLVLPALLVSRERS
jgi:predicted RND superfamily exporter protein